MRDVEFRGLTENGWAYTSFLNIMKEQTMHPIEYFRVDPDTIGEWTGLWDRNGVKIFEGDIVRTQPIYDKPYSAKRKGKQFIGKVVLYQTKVGIFSVVDSKWSVDLLRTEDDDKYDYFSWSLFYDCEVIGNIYQNPELLSRDGRTAVSSKGTKE